MERKVPKLRFKGFSEEYNTEIFEKLFDYIPTNTYSRDKMNSGNNSEYYNIHYGDIHTKYSTILDVSKTNIPFINEKDIKNTYKNNICKEGDLIISDTSEDYKDVGKAIELKNVNKNIVAGLHTYLCRDINKIFFIGYKGYLFKSTHIKNQENVIAAGIKVLSINKSNLNKIKISFPSIKEQEKIANFFTRLDERIETQEKLIEHLENEKKGYMQKIFSKEFRFKDKNGKDYPKWEEKRLGEVYFERNERSKGGEILLSVTMNNGVKLRSEIEGKDTSNEDKSKYKIVKINDMVYNTMRMWQGANGISNYNGIVSPAYTVMFSSENISDKFMGYYFKCKDLIFEFYKHSQGLTSDTWNCKYEQLKNIKIKMPLFLEQEKIANFLSALDKKLELEKDLLEKLKIEKKGYMQQMFI